MFASKKVLYASTVLRTVVRVAGLHPARHVAGTVLAVSVRLPGYSKGRESGSYRGPPGGVSVYSL